MIAMVTPFSINVDPMHRILKSRACSPLLALSTAALMSLAPMAAEADSDRHHHRHGREYKEKYWDGACKVERKWKRNGEYTEKRKCRDDYRGGYYAPPQVVMPMAAPAIIINPPPIIIRP
jgi:hypothetical protein